MSDQHEKDTLRLRKMLLVAVAFVLSMVLLHFAGQGTMVIGSV